MREDMKKCYCVQPWNNPHCDLKLYVSPAIAASLGLEGVKTTVEYLAEAERKRQLEWLHRWPEAKPSGGL